MTDEKIQVAFDEWKVVIDVLDEIAAIEGVERSALLRRAARSIAGNHKPGLLASLPPLRGRGRPRLQKDAAE